MRRNGDTMKELPKTYDPSSFEDRLYKTWSERGYFKPSDDRNAPTYSIVIPPPNITGQLHMGHALDNTLQDVLVRYKRMKGFSTLWVPGTDHASIATEAKIVEAMRREGITKDDIGRDGFLERAWSSSRSSVPPAIGRESALRWTKDAPKRCARFSSAFTKRDSFTAERE